MKDWNGYINRMSKAMQEEMFFTKEINLDEYDAVVDFGCANGELLRKIDLKGYHMDKIGFDISKEMIKSAESLSEPFMNIFFVQTLEDLRDWMQDYETILVIFSSVWHEIDPIMYSEIYKTVFGAADTIVIRDMFYPEIEPQNGVEQIGSSFRKVLENGIAKDMFDEYEKIWGKVEYYDWNFYHLLLKYTYVENWKTEVQEFYFGTPWNSIIAEARKRNFTIAHDFKYTLGYKQVEVFRNFDYAMSEPTHRNLILMKNYN